MDNETTPSFEELPGFRFKPTEEELLSFYLRNMVNRNKMNPDIIGFLNIYRHAPWDLPGLAKIGEREWYFFVPRDRKHSNGGRPNRTTEHGFWKATGSDRKIVSLSEPKRVIGLRKTLVFYKGRAPRGSKTDWVMNEYRLQDNHLLNKDIDIVLCKIYRKATSLKELEQRAAREEALVEKSTIAASYPTSPVSSSNGTASFCDGFISGGNGGQLEDLLPPMSKNDHVTAFKKEQVEVKLDNMETNCRLAPSNTIQLPFGKESLGELQVPRLGMEWSQDPFCAPSCSPWLENLLMNFSSPTLLTHFLST